MDSERRPLGRIVPPDWDHMTRYGLRGAAPEVVRGQGGVAGINWYQDFDRPVWDPADRKWWIGRNASALGAIRGGHAICGHVVGTEDTRKWWGFYDQGAEWPGKPENDYSSCVGFSTARYATNKNRVRYDAYDIYHWAQDNDPWPGRDYPGTALRSGFDCLRQRGPVRAKAGSTSTSVRPQAAPRPEDGIDVFRWAENLDQVRAALNVPDYVAGVPFLQSWGYGYPHIVWMADEAADRVIFREDGEFGIVTDR